MHVQAGQLTNAGSKLRSSHRLCGDEPHQLCVAVLCVCISGAIAAVSDSCAALSYLTASEHNSLFSPLRNC
jgi:hypothetical protein